MFQNFDRMIANLSGSLVSCHQVMQYVNPFINNYNEMLASKEKTNAKTVAATTLISAQPAKIKQPEFSSFDVIKQRALEKTKALTATKDDLARLNN
jgi:hypothetical protein